MAKASFYGNLGLEELTILKPKRIDMSKGVTQSICFLVYICFFKRQRDVPHTLWDSCHKRQTKISVGITLQLRHCSLKVVTTTMQTIHTFYGLFESPITWPLIPSWRLIFNSFSHFCSSRIKSSFIHSFMLLYEEVSK